MSERAQILVIDDEPHPRRFTVRLLERAGYAVIEASTGEEGLRLARELRPDLILLDVVLPDLDGFEVCRRIKTDPDLEHMLVILLSGKRVDSDSLAEGLEGGADGYILRGTPTREFLARVEAWLRIQRVEHKLRESESWRELAIAGSNGGIWHVQLDPDDLTHTLPDEVFLSTRLKRFIGYEADEFPDSMAAWERRVHPEDLPRLRESSIRHRRGETELHELEYRIRHKDGSIRWLYTCGRIERDADGRPARFAGMDWDVTERKQAEEVLRWNKAIVTSIPDPISYVDRDYVYRAVNETYSRYAKRPAHELVGLTVAELLGQKAFEAAVRPHLDRCFAGHDVHYQAWFDVPEEPPKYMDVGYYPVLDESGAVVGAVVQSRDITQRKQAEDALREQTHRLDERVKELNCLYEISRLVERPGITLPEILGGTTEILPAAWRYPEVACARIVLDDQQYRTANYRSDAPWQQTAVVQVHGQPRGNVEVCYLESRPEGDEDPFLSEERDLLNAVAERVGRIVERWEAQESLRQERDLVARIMETSPVGIVVLDRQGQITFVNAQILQVTGLTREQIVQLSYNDPTWKMVDETGRSLPNDLLPFPRLMRDGEPIYDLQQVVELPSAAGGGPRHMHLSMNAAPIYDASGAVDGVVVTIEDITERVRLQEQVRQHAVELEQRVAERTAELRASQAALLRAERLAVAGKLAASLTHEISNPLQSVIGCLGLAEETLDEGGDVRQYLEIALPELRRVSRIVARLRNLGRSPSPVSSRESTDVGDLLEQVQALIRKQCQDQGIVLRWQVPPDLPGVHVVPDQLQQVFLNLAINAIEAMPGGGRIDAHAARTVGPPGVSISFQDSGVGISSDALPRVFEPFYSTKPEGLGLGLSISQEIVQQHGGRLEATSELGHGATFTVWLPAHP
jgi:PAS domain S-box-containing protein